MFKLAALPATTVKLGPVSFLEKEKGGKNSEALTHVSYSSTGYGVYDGVIDCPGVCDRKGEGPGDSGVQTREAE